MFLQRSFRAALAAAAIMTSGCASNPPGTVMTTQGSTLVQPGTVTDVRDVTVHGGRPSGVGSFVGTLLGGVAGSRIGSGNGSVAAGIGGALAGGMAGQRIEEAGKNAAATELSVQLDSGEVRQYRVAPGEPYRIGDRVRITTVKGVPTVSRE